VLGEGRLQDALRAMVVDLSKVMHGLAVTASNVGSSGAEILATMRSQEQGVLEQTSAVEEIEKAMGTLLDSSREVARRCSAVAANAKRDYTNVTKIAGQIHTLSHHGARIGELTEFVKDIANKADLLALNAALEGTRAGESGKGFALVAAQMQRLAEQVMESSRDIEALASEIRADTQASVLSTEESTQLSTETTRLAEEIALIARQQESGTEQASRAIADILAISKQTVSGTGQVITAAEDLKEMAESLETLTRRFQRSRTGTTGE
jgi:methyl-accepting chemotaxis protein